MMGKTKDGGKERKVEASGNRPTGGGWFTTPATVEYLGNSSSTLTIPFEAGAAQHADCGIRVDRQLLARMIPCAVAGCTETYTAPDGEVSPSSKFICKHHPRSLQSRTFEHYAKDYSSEPPNTWTFQPKYEMTDSGKKSYPYQFRSKNKLPENRLTLRLDVEPSPTLNGLISITMGTTLTGEELYSLVPPKAYERLKQVCINAVSTKKQRRKPAEPKRESEVGVVQRNYVTDPIVTSAELQITAPSGKLFLSWSADPKPEIDFPTWVSKLPWSEQPTADSYKLFFGRARQTKLKREFGTQGALLVYKLPSLGDLPRKELFRVCAERKHLFKTVDKFLRNVASELFKHSESIGGSPDPRKTCPRCGGNWLKQQATSFRCRDCGQYQYLGGKDEFDKLEQKILAKSHHTADFGQMSEQTERSKLLSDAGFTSSEQNSVTVYTLPPDEPNIARMTKEEFVSVLLHNLPKYNRTKSLASRLTVLGQHFLGTNDWFLRDYAESVGVPEETANTWVKRFRQQVEQYRAENHENVVLNDEAEARFKSLLLNKIAK